MHNGARAAMHNGVMDRWCYGENQEKRYGVIQRDADNSTFFCHISDMVGGLPVEGDSVNFTVEWDKARKKYKVVNVHRTSKSKGIVSEWVINRNYGWITTSDGNDKIWFHFHSIAHSNDPISTGVEVAYWNVWNEQYGCLQAEYIHVEFDPFDGATDAPVTTDADADADADLTKEMVALTVNNIKRRRLNSKLANSVDPVNLSEDRTDPVDQSHVDFVGVNDLHACV